jgi:hypothetical protein
MTPALLMSMLMIIICSRRRGVGTRQVGYGCRTEKPARALMQVIKLQFGQQNCGRMVSAYGGTAQASMSLSTAGNIADLNNSDSVDYTDMMAIVNKWLYQEILLPEDLDRNGVVNIADFTIFANEWFWGE